MASPVIRLTFTRAVGWLGVRASLWRGCAFTPLSREVDTNVERDWHNSLGYSCGWYFLTQFTYEAWAMSFDKAAVWRREGTGSAQCNGRHTAPSTWILPTVSAPFHTSLGKALEAAPPSQAFLGRTQYLECTWRWGVFLYWAAAERGAGRDTAVVGRKEVHFLFCQCSYLSGGAQSAHLVERLHFSGLTDQQSEPRFWSYYLQE